MARADASQRTGCNQRATFGESHRACVRCDTHSSWVSGWLSGVNILKVQNAPTCPPGPAAQATGKRLGFQGGK